MEGLDVWLRSTQLRVADGLDRAASWTLTFS